MVYWEEKIRPMTTLVCVVLQVAQGTSGQTAEVLALSGSHAENARAFRPHRENGERERESGRRKTWTRLYTVELEQERERERERERKSRKVVLYVKRGKRKGKANKFRSYMMKRFEIKSMRFRKPETIDFFKRK